MSRAKNNQREKAKEMFYKGKSLVDIAKKLGISEGTVRSWKSRDGWDNRDSPKTQKKTSATLQKSVAKKSQSATLQKNKGGAPEGNKNAKGNRGNPSPVPPIVHGGYSKHYWDGLDEDEQALIEEMSEDPEVLLMDTIKTCTLRERKLRMAISKYENEKLYIASVATQKTQRKFKDEEEEAQYQRMIQQKIDKGDRLPGEAEQITTVTQSTIDLVARLQRELTSVSNQKARAIESLHKMQAEKENAGDANSLKIWADHVKILRSKDGDKND